MPVVTNNHIVAENSTGIILQLKRSEDKVVSLSETEVLAGLPFLKTPEIALSCLSGF